DPSAGEREDFRRWGRVCGCRRNRGGWPHKHGRRVQHGLELPPLRRRRVHVVGQGSEAGVRAGGSDGRGAGAAAVTPQMKRESLERYKEQLIDAAILGLPLAAIEWVHGRIFNLLTS